MADAARLDFCAPGFYPNRVPLLVPHSEFLAPAGLSIRANAVRTDDRLSLRFEARGATDAIAWPARTDGERRDELWRTTCFEAFVGSVGDGGYHEFNLAPSGDWATYRFDGYRAGMRDAAPVPKVELGPNHLSAEIDLAATDLAGRDWQVALTAVIEATDGTRSFWALRHAPGAPDFHHRACFALELPALR